MRRLLIAVTLGSVCACGLISGASDLVVVDDAQDATSDTGATAEAGPVDIDSGTFEPPPPSCNAPSRCVTAPSGWEGPFAVVLSDAQGRGIQCPPTFARSWERSGATTADASAPRASCTCACGALTGACAITMNEHDDSACMDAPSKRVLGVGACVPRASGADSWHATTAVTSAACAPDASVTVPPLGGDASTVGCVPTAPEGCAAGACFPPLTDGARLCVRPAGIDDGASCPVDFSDEVKLASGLEDSRGCTVCTCPASPSCSFTYELHGKANCLGEVPSSFSDTNCHAPSGIDAIKLTASRATGSCTPTGGTPTGTLKTIGDSRLCCAR